MVFERGLKVLLDISTYADLDAHTEHLATARVLGVLDRRVTECLRAGSRRKCLLFVDEVHSLGPKAERPISTPTTSASLSTYCRQSTTIREKTAGSTA
jgi:hypothetical protein